LRARRGSTALTYQVVAQRHLIKDAIGAVRLDKLRRAHVQALIDRKAAQGYAPRYVKQIHGILDHALARAVRVGILPLNPADGIDLPPQRDHPLSVFSEDETRRFLAGAAGDDLEALWIVAATLGLRRGELIGLRWPDVDLARGTLTVQRTHRRVPERGWIIADDAKSDSSRRTIQLPSVCVAALRSHRARQLERRLKLGAAWNDTGAVFDTGDGAHIHDPRYLGRRFEPLTDRLGLPRIKFHGLRHTAATNMLKRGVPVHVVAQMLGHNDPGITLRVYAHVLADMQQDAAARIDAMFGT
jgi:integrase